jgi:outer membrane immunogenic protein
MVRSGAFALVVSLALIASAQAADLPSEKGPALYAPPPPVFSWTGLYVGVTAGGVFGHQTLSVQPTAGPYGSLGANDGGFAGGGEAGFNYQIPASNVVLGGETDFQGSTFGSDYGMLATPSGAFTGSSHLDWWGSARARLGLSFGNVLPYVTGGFAYGDERDQGSLGATTFSDNGVRTGWTAGAGVEYAITRNLTAKAEYLYTDLGSLSTPLAGGTVHDRATFHAVRAGLNWKFDWTGAPAPINSKY